MDLEKKIDIELNHRKFFSQLPLKLKKGLYLVGGIFSSLYFGKGVKDIDLVVNDVENYKKLLEGHFKRKFHIIIDKKGHKLIKFMMQSTFFDINELERNIINDAKRRDFTINSIYYDIGEKKIMDPLNGLNDIRSRTIKMSSDNFLCLDPVRFLRYYRFIAEYDLIPEEKTNFQIENFSINEVIKMPIERVALEFKKLISLKNSFHTINELEKKQFLTALFPFMKITKEVEQNEYHSFDLYSHSLLALKWAEHYIDKFNYSGDIYTLKLAIFFHDIGKAKTKSIKDQKVHFYGHENVGAEIIRKELKNYSISKKEINKISLLVKEHMYLSYLKFHNTVSEKVIRKFIRKNEDITNELLIIFLSDGAAAHDRIDAGQERFAEIFREKLKEIKEADREKEKKIITGMDLLKLGYKNGPIIGKMIKKICELYDEGKIKDKREAVEYAKKHIKDQ